MGEEHAGERPVLEGEVTALGGGGLEGGELRLREMWRDRSAANASDIDNSPAARACFCSKLLNSSFHQQLQLPIVRVPKPSQSSLLPRFS